MSLWAPLELAQEVEVTTEMSVEAILLTFQTAEVLMGWL